MAEKNSKKKNHEDQEPESSSNPVSSRLEAHKRAQQENNSHMARVFDILERARNNMRDLEKQRLCHMEGLKSLRDRLFQENESLRLTAAELRGNFATSPAASSLVLPGSSKTVAGIPQQPVEIAAKASTSSCPRRTTSNKSMASATKTPSRTLSLATSLGPPPKAISSRSLHRKRSQRYDRKSKHRMLPSSQDNISNVSEESEQVATARNLKQRLLSNFKY